MCKFSEWTLHELTANLFLGTNSCKYNKHKRIPLSTNLLKLNYFLLRFLVGSCNKNLKSSTLAPSEFYLTIFLRIESTIWRPKSGPIVYSFRGENNSLIAFYILFLFIDQLTHKLVHSCKLIKSTFTSFSKPTVTLLTLVQVLLLCSQYTTSSLGNVQRGPCLR